MPTATEAAPGMEGGATGDQGTDALGDALQMMVQALSQMHEAIQKIELKMDRSEDTVRCLKERLDKLETKMERIDEALAAELATELARVREEEAQERAQDEVEDTPAAQTTPGDALVADQDRASARRERSAKGMTVVVASVTTTAGMEAGEAVDGGGSDKASTDIDTKRAVSESPSVHSASSTTSAGGWSNTLSPPMQVSRGPSRAVSRTRRQMAANAYNLGSRHARPCKRKGKALEADGAEAGAGSGAGLLPGMDDPRDVLGHQLLKAAQGPPRGRCPSSIRWVRKGSALKANTLCKSRPRTMANRELLWRRLMKAIQDGKVREVKHLLKEGADVNYTNRSRWTPLHVAALRGQTDVVSLLLEKGANHNAKNAYGFTALHIAARSDFSGMCSCFLIYAGSDVNARNQFGRTPLHYAAECGNVASVRALIVGGAKKNAKDHEGKRPYDVAKSHLVHKFLRP